MIFAVLLYLIRVAELAFNYRRLRARFLEDTKDLVPPAWSSLEEAAHANTVFRIIAWPIIDLALIALRIRNIIRAAR